MLSRSDNKRLSIAIVGGGIGGVALAVGLSRDPGLEVHLFEAVQQFSEIGAGVSFGPNAVRSICLLGLEDAYRSIADSTPPPSEDVWFEWRRWHDDEYLSASLAPGCGQSSVHRADFLDAIVQHLPQGTAHFGKRCITIEQDDDGVTLHFEDGSDFHCDALIGFDGIKSAVREHVLPASQYGDLGPQWSGTYAYRGMIDSDTLASAMQAKGADSRLAVVPQMYLGPDRHILTFPVKHSSLINVVAFITDRSTPNPRLPEGEAWVTGVSQEQMLADFEGWGPASQAILEGIPQPTRWALHDLPQLPHYCRHRVLLAGDAAHAMLPHQGSGAGQALEDAVVLAELLTDADCDREPNVVQRKAGDVYEYAGQDTGRDEHRIKSDLESRFDWIWQHDPLDDVAHAKGQLGWC
ncbi:salicylate 1-monooxygenase [Halomonas binhaiensis]|uniref:Salicylate 1-monooxygenase n=1 Tax=Halomonas binhaiensis TaxID=2562282 RepID=A0A5C1NJJ9_9GAMM|nr:salicylate 1-monooxygenase [Halomonas binhaiensis]QEM82970.1 salicylate 1-monooxygenase [Halomonas binhaiensis]